MAPSPLPGNRETGIAWAAGSRRGVDDAVCRKAGRRERRQRKRAVSRVGLAAIVHGRGISAMAPRARPKCWRHGKLRH